MLIKFTIRIMGRSQKHTFRSIIGFSLIIAMMISTSGVISGFSSQIFWITAKAGESSTIFIQADTDTGEIPQEVLPKINHTNIQFILPFMKREVNVSSSVEAFKATLVGVNLSSLLDYYNNADIYAGRAPYQNTSAIECLIGKNLESLIGSSIITISDSLDIFNVNINIVGLIQNINEFQNFIILRIDEFCNISNVETSNLVFNIIKIKLKNGVFIDQTIKDLKTSLSVFDIPFIIKPEQQAEIFTISLFYDILSKLNLLFGVLFIIALIRVFHTITWFVKKYERDLLIMRAMGLSDFQIFFIVVFLAEIIGNIGFLIGFLFGLLIPSGISTILYFFIAGGFLIPNFDPIALISLLFFSNIISIIAALYPAFSTAKKAPSALSSSTHRSDR